MLLEYAKTQRREEEINSLLSVFASSRTNSYKMSIIRRLLDLMYPNLCSVCGEALVKNEKYLCLSCLSAFPKTDFHLHPDNELEKRFWGKVEIAGGTAFFFYEKGTELQQALYHLKYRGGKELGKVLGRYAGAVLRDCPAFASADYIVPVPLHPKKLAKRGYNQSEWVAKGLAEVLEKPMDTAHLVRIKENESQTRKSAFERYSNTEGIFLLNDSRTFAGKHILLVDDVLTTGSTMEACVHALHTAPDVTVSVFALAMAR